MALGRKVGEAYVEVTTDVDVRGSENEIADGIGAALRNGIGSGVRASAVGITAAGALVGGALIAGVAGAMDREVVVDRLNASLGATGADAERIGSAAGDLYADAFGESLEEVASAVGAIELNLGRDLDLVGTEQALEGATANALNLASVLDEDVGRVARTAGQLIRNGLAATSEEAFDLIAAGATNGLNRSEDLLDTLNEYAPAFARLGIDGDQALGLLNTGLEAGVFNTDKIGDAFNEFSIRAIDGSSASEAALSSLGIQADVFAQTIAAGGPAAAQATSEVIAALRDIDDEVAQDAAGVALFGSIWEDLGSDAILALDPIGSSLEGVDGSAALLGDTLNDNLSTRIETLKRRGFQALADVAERYVVPALERFADWAGRELPRAFEKFQRDVLPIIEAVVEWIGENLPRAFEFFQNEVLPRLETVAAAIGAFIDGVIAAWEIFGPTIVEFVTEMVAIIVERVEALVSLFDGLIDFVRSVFTGEWGAAWDAILQIFSAVWALIVGVVDEAWLRLRTAVTLVLDGVKLLWDWSFLSEVVSGAADAVIGFISGLPGRIGELAGDLLTAGLDAGGALVDGLVAGVGLGVQAVADAARSVVNGVFDVLRDFDFTVEWGGFDPPGPGSIPGFSFTFDPFEGLPSLATGGVASDPMLAVIGDAGRGNPEIVSPVRLMADTFRAVLDRSGGGGVVFEEGAIVVSLASGTPSEAARVGGIIGDSVAQRLAARRSSVRQRVEVGL